MVSSVNPIDLAVSGLRAAQAQLNVTSNNVANASTIGYSRKLLQQYSNILADQGAGARVGIVQRSVDEILLRDYRTQVSKTSELATRSHYIQQIQDFHGPPDGEQSITSFIGKLKDSFSELANQPESLYLLQAVYAQAEQVVEKFAAYSDKLTRLRNTAQDEMQVSVATINSLTAQIADLNVSIKLLSTTDQSTAALEDQRDEAIKALAEEIDISYFKAENGSVIVQTREGQSLADTTSYKVFFSPSAIGPGSYYPASAAGVRLIDPTTGPDLTQVENLGGKLGELIRLRDETLPLYQAQADEMAHKMAMRFSAEGLDLFTLPDGTIPANTPSSYVGFSTGMVINPDITSDITLIRKGTGSSTIQAGSAELLRKIVEFTFGDTEYQRARGTVDISNVVPTLFTTLGITGSARLVGTTNISALGALDSSAFINPPVEDDFTIQVGVGVPQTITITAGMTAANLVSAINVAFPGMAQLGNGGELVLTATDTLTIGAGSLGVPGLAELGLVAGATAAIPPSFTIRAGNDAPTTIQILSTDTTTQLLSKLNAVPGITATLTVGGFLNIEPTDGGDITLVDGTNSPLAALGVSVTNIPHTDFNLTGLGPNSDIDGEVRGAITLQNYISQAISLQSRYANDAETNSVAENSYKNTIETEYLNNVGVNIDEEMAKLITIQTAYSASARTVKTIQDLLDELFAAI